MLFFNHSCLCPDHDVGVRSPLVGPLSSPIRLRSPLVGPLSSPIRLRSPLVGPLSSPIRLRSPLVGPLSSPIRLRSPLVGPLSSPIRHYIPRSESGGERRGGRVAPCVLLASPCCNIPSPVPRRLCRTGVEFHILVKGKGVHDEFLDALRHIPLTFRPHGIVEHASRPFAQECA